MAARHETEHEKDVHDVRGLLLGPPRLLLDGGCTPCPALGLKERALLWWLLTERRPAGRSELVRLLWADLPEEAGRANLRVALSHLRHHLPGLLTTEGQEVGFAEAVVVAGGIAADVQELHRATHDPQCPPARQRSAADAWRGEFLAGFTLPGCDEYGQWIETTRRRVAMQAVALRRTLMHAAEDRLQSDEAMHHARALLDLDEADEMAHMVLMRLLAQAGERSAALRQYEACCSALAEQFGARPSARCYALYVRIHADTLPVRMDLPVPSGPTAALRVH
ncbi:MAG: hypothetical protein RL489_1985 [Pseudomonadota bacterium]|jgi:DNA-binding SARP family transcriptional activator